VLEAAHIRPYAGHGGHEVTNGLLLRTDIHRLFDRGYVTVTPDYEFRVSDRLRSDYANGKTYYALNNRRIALPADVRYAPSREALAWHAEQCFLR
jgi:putative restriction endonuclease